MTVENISLSISTKECCRPRRGSNPQPPGLQSDAHPTEPPRPALDALCKGSYGAFCRQTKTQDKSHLGVRDLCTARCNSKDLIHSDKTGLEPILLPVLNLRVLDIIDLYPLKVLI